MARSNNFLLGQGERLTHSVTVPAGGGVKKPPYTFTTARRELSPRLTATTETFKALPSAARPDDQVVAVVTMHPRYISKSDFPAELLNAFGLKPIGSRTRKVKPRKWGIENPPESALGNDIFVVGSLSAFGDWDRELPTSKESVRWSKDLTHVEDIAAFTGIAKLRNVSPAEGERLYEIVIHNAHSDRVVRRFIRYARELNIDALQEWRRDVGGLTFLPVRGTDQQVRLLADFSFVRVARPMPRLRVLGPELVRLAAKTKFAVPTGPALDTDSGVVIFDGGLPPNVDLSRWVTLVEPPGIGIANPDLQEHGLAVTSAVLFGNLGHGAPVRALCHADHVRILDAQTKGADVEYLEVLDRIVTHLTNTRGKYQFGNISVGPQLPITDDEVTQWTAQLDEFFADGAMLTTVAVGNDGEESAQFDLNRIQPPSDGVNVLSVGACDSETGAWQRASYSCVGPGRAPGIVKPDGLAFGGTPSNPYFVVSSRPTVCASGVTGTSIGAPHALRSGIAVHAQLGDALTPLAIRALLIHRAEEGESQDRREAGWGRFVSDYGALITCDDDESLVVYQGELPVEHHLRAPIALPDSTKTRLQGWVYITATLVIATDVDPEHAGAYTRSGVRVSFRPNASRFTHYKDGKVSVHPTTEGFFSERNMYAAAEYDLQEQGQKWEPCLRATRKKSARTLLEPCFDINYQNRDGLSRATLPPSVNYALILSVRVPKVADFYNRVVRDYASVLVPIQPRQRLGIRL